MVKALLRPKTSADIRQEAQSNLSRRDLQALKDYRLLQIGAARNYLDCMTTPLWWADRQIRIKAIDNEVEAEELERARQEAERKAKARR